MKKIDKNYPPLVLLRELTRLYPSAWRYMKDFHDNNGKDGLPSFPSWCYAPIGAAMAVANINGNVFENMERAQQIAALAPWRESKEVYIFSEDLERMLCNQADDINIPAEVLLNLPYYSIYVDCNYLTIPNIDIKIDGFFCHLEFDVNNGEKELRFLFITNFGTMPRFVHLKGKNLIESFEIEKEVILDNSQKLVKTEETEEIINIFENFVMPDTLELEKKALQMVLYICSENTDIEQYGKEKRFGRVRDRPEEVRVWDAGENVSKALRQEWKKTGGTKSPHLRKGHWHHFWTGRREEPTERRLKRLACRCPAGLAALYATPQGGTRRWRG